MTTTQHIDVNDMFSNVDFVAISTGYESRLEHVIGDIENVINEGLKFSCSDEFVACTCIKIAQWRKKGISRISNETMFSDATSSYTYEQRCDDTANIIKLWSNCEEGLVLKLQKNSKLKNMHDILQFASHLKKYEYCACFNADIPLDIKFHFDANDKLVVLRYDAESG